jgi:hypothetical protein
LLGLPQASRILRINPDSAVDRENHERAANLSAAKAIVSASEKAVAVVPLRKVEQNKGGEPSTKKTLKLSTLVSSLLQAYPSPIFNCGIQDKSARNLFPGCDAGQLKCSASHFFFRGLDIKNDQWNKKFNLKTILT